MRDLVVLSLEAWDEVWRRNQHLLAGLLRTEPQGRVLFVEPAADPLHDVVAGRWPRGARGLRAVPLEGVAAGRLWAYQPTKLLPRRLDPHVDRRAADAVQRIARRLGFTAPLLWVNDPAGAAVLAATGWPALYDITDDWLAAHRTPAEHARLVRDEAFLLERCAEVVVCSPALARTKAARRVTLIPNGVDGGLHVPHARPRDLPAGPVALYLGTAHPDRLDLNLCATTAAAIRGRGHLVLVGPAPLTAGERARLAGVVLLGARDWRAVPGYLQHADVLVVPHVVTPFTESLDPIKRYEYRAVGRPVVSTPVAGFRGTGVTVAQGAAFAAAVARHLPAATRFPAGADRTVPTWATRVAEMRAVLERFP